MSPTAAPPCIAILVTTSSRQSSIAKASSAGQPAASAMPASQGARRSVSVRFGARLSRAGMARAPSEGSGRDGRDGGIPLVEDRNERFESGGLQHAPDQLARLQQDEAAALGANGLGALKQETKAERSHEVDAGQIDDDGAIRAGHGAEAQLDGPHAGRIE